MSTDRIQMRFRAGVVIPAMLLLAAIISCSPRIWAQWEMLESHTTASLRGIFNAGGGVVWASGSDGTVLRSLDDGKLWQSCAVAPGAEKLDFRGIQAWDKDTALAMSSGPGEQSRLYKTTDGCKSWKLVFTNPDGKGFFDSLHKVTEKQLYLLGDPVDHKFSMFFSPDAGNSWFIADDPGLEAAGDESAFAASNSALTSVGPFLLFGTGGDATAHVYRSVSRCNAASSACSMAWVKAGSPILAANRSSGVFSLAARMTTSANGVSKVLVVAVGGTYDKPDAAVSNAATSFDGGEHWTSSAAPPSGYRSAVAFDRSTQEWITVGPNGTDASMNDGRNWRTLKPSAGDPPDADKNWNALSLPFVVGSNGRIGRLRAFGNP